MLKSSLGEDSKEQADAQSPALTSGMTPAGTSQSAVGGALPRHSRMAVVQSYMDEMFEKNEARWKAAQSEMVATIVHCQNQSLAELKSTTLSISAQIHKLSRDLGSQSTAPTSLTAATDDSDAFPFECGVRTSHMDDVSLVGNDLETGLSQKQAFAKTSDGLPEKIKEKVNVILSEVKSVLGKIKSGKCKSISSKLLKLRARVKATLSLDFESESRSVVDTTSSVALTPTQQLTLWRAYGSLSDAWIEDIGVVSLKKNKTQAEKIKVLQNDVVILCSAKYSELSESRTDTFSSQRTLPRLSRIGPKYSLESVAEDSITSMTDSGHFTDAIDTDAIMASAKARHSIDFDDVQSVDGSHDLSASESDRDPFVPLTTTHTLLSAESQRTLQLYAPTVCVSTASASQTTSGSAETRTRKLSMAWLRSKPKRLRIRHKQKLLVQPSTDSVKEGEVFLGYESPSQKESTSSESSTATQRPTSSSRKKTVSKRFAWLGF